MADETVEEIVGGGDLGAGAEVEQEIVEPDSPTSESVEQPAAEAEPEAEEIAPDEAEVVAASAEPETTFEPEAGSAEPGQDAPAPDEPELAAVASEPESEPGETDPAENDSDESKPAA